MIGSPAVNVSARSHCPSPNADLHQHPTQAAQSLPALSLISLSAAAASCSSTQVFDGKIPGKKWPPWGNALHICQKTKQTQKPKCRRGTQMATLLWFRLSSLLASPGARVTRKPSPHAVWLCTADTVSLLPLESSANAIADFGNFTFRIQISHIYGQLITSEMFNAPFQDVHFENCKAVCFELNAEPLTASWCRCFGFLPCCDEALWENNLRGGKSKRETKARTQSRNLKARLVCSSMRHCRQSRSSLQEA